MVDWSPGQHQILTLTLGCLAELERQGRLDREVWGHADDPDTTGRAPQGSAAPAIR